MTRSTRPRVHDKRLYYMYIPTNAKEKPLAVFIVVCYMYTPQRAFLSRGLFIHFFSSLLQQRAIVGRRAGA